MLHLELPGVCDFVVVGAGSSGCVVAASLIERNVGSVLLLEAGHRASHPLIRRPVTYPHLFENAQFSHQYRTVPQTQLAKRRILLPAGKGLGGSSLLNAMILCPPHRKDFDDWERLAGPLWSWQNLKEHANWVETLYQRAIDEANPISSFGHQILDACKGGESDGQLFAYRRAVLKGRRVTAWSLLKARCHSPRFQVRRGVEVTRILLEGDRAAGLEVIDHDRSASEVIRVRKGVILCAGSLASPVLLMKSGIGPKEDIGSSMSCKIDSPMVGKNLQDHMVFPITCSTRLPTLPSIFSHDEQRKWLTNGEGPLASNIAEIGAFGSKKQNGLFGISSDTNREQPTMQWHITPTHYLEYPTKTPPSDCMSVAVTLLHPESRGEVRSCRDGTIEIDPGYLSVEEDRKNWIEMIQWSRSWVNNGPLSRFLEAEVLPGTRRATDDQLSIVIDRLANTVYHYVGSCSVGVKPDTVCDPEFRVRGCEGLYVCDASILPTQVSGNTQWTVMMMARQLAMTLE